MIVSKTQLPGVLILEPKVFGDNRGWFMESFSNRDFESVGINNVFIQDNHSYSAAKGVIRGLHFQNSPKSQTKLIRCTRGGILDVIVDIRKDSPTYCKWISVELNSENKMQILIPKGFAHGFLTLTDDTEVQYKVDEYYSPLHDRSIRFDDPHINVDWGITNPILSQKDLSAPFLKDSDCNYGVKVLVTGVNGQLGHDVIRLLKENEIECLGVDINDFDLTNEVQTTEFIKGYSPDVIVHCAAYTAVDRAEDDKEKCFAVNVTGTQNIVAAAKITGAKVMYISTDYVFDGNGDRPFEEYADTAPINYYGKSKLDGENIVRNQIDNHFIIRTSWVFGSNGNNFIKTMLRLGIERGAVSVINDQIGSPTYTLDLAKLICDMIFTSKYGTYHASNEGYCSWYEFACYTFESAGVNVKTTPITTDQYPTKAKRPHNSRLSKDGLEREGFKRLPDWKDAVSRYLMEIDEYKNIKKYE